ncbi:carotenoid biosynthesis protein [Pedobacter sp. SD-b]|uniref:Carotenoid biosynthesis protein n=1 Tax=Pedobacter segetis TaxID=2793069 RepID=A0ABS1BLH5_9SPHI|nr:carotenoid biosynthesis protein [Pedobacter segetis]MBK0383743.1 carotenoid biosynthesis protein [Pedobacter segetis]
MKYLDKAGISKIFIIIFHVVGFIGFSIPDYHDFFLSFVPYHLLLMAAILMANQKEYNRNFWVAFIFVYLSGYLIEVVGVATGAIFGVYHYGETLGIKFLDVPLLIGINWVIIIFSVGAILKKHFKHQRTVKSLVGAAILVGLDFLIEPVAVRFDYWAWENSEIPLQNFTAWFFIVFVLLRTYYELDFRKSNPVAFTMVVCQFLFFLGLNLTIA